MKKIYLICLAALALTACQKPQYVEPTAQRQGITSFTATITGDKYPDAILSKLTLDEATYESGEYVMEIPYYYPETSEDGTLGYMSALRIQAELQPNFKITPALGLLDMTETHTFTLTDPFGETSQFTLSAKRVKPKACSLLTLLIKDVMVSGVIYENDKKVLIPYLEDLSDVQIKAQVSSHATISKVNGQAYDAQNRYDMNTGATITVLAGNGTTSQTYNIEQGIPELLESGLNKNSIANLFHIDATAIAHLPAYTELSYVSLAGIGTQLAVGLGNGSAPKLLNTYTGAEEGEMLLGDAVADAITNDENGNVLVVNFATGGDQAQTLNIYRTSSFSEAPTLFYSFLNPIDVPLGHRIKVVGDIDTQAAIVLTAEGVDGITLTAKAVVLYVQDGAVTKVETVDFASLTGGWGSAPINYATVVAASTTPDVDGWFFDYYEGNCDADGLYLLHYVTARIQDNIVARLGNWAHNPNCLDLKTFNHNRYMTLFVVSHFPVWSISPRIYLFDVNEPTAASIVMQNDAISLFQTGSYSPDYGASGDVTMVPTTDGYRMFVYYYDHHSQCIGAYVADCFKI